MLTVQKRNKPKGSNITMAEFTQSKERAVKHMRNVMRGKDIDPEYGYALAMGCLFLMRGQNGLFTGNIDCPLTHELYDDVVCNMAKRWAEVDPKAEMVVKAFEDNAPSLVAHQA